MHLSRAIFLALALLSAGSAAAHERADIRIRLVLMDECTIDAGQRMHGGAIKVKCSSGEPYRVDALSGSEPAPTVAARMASGKQGPRRPALAISF